MDVICVLPARLSSTRIPRKLLAPIAGRSLLEWAWRAASRVSELDRIVVAADSPEVEACARGFEAQVVRTRADHPSGTDRVEEAAKLLSAGDDDIIVNFQADEPFVDARTVGRAVSALRRHRTGGGGGTAGGAGAPERADISTLACPITDAAEWRSPGTVKVVRAADGSALYFSRSAIPFARDAAPEGGVPPAVALRHIGIYACRRGALGRWASLEESALERVERLEQLRALEAGMRIHVEVGPATEPGIDLPADLERAERVLSNSR